MIVIDCLAKLIIMTEGLFHLFTLSVGLVEVVFRVMIVSIGDADITPGRQPMLHDDARLGQCLIGTLQHLIQLLGIHIYLSKTQIGRCRTFVRKVTVLIFDGLIKTLFGLVVSTQVTLHRCNSIGGSEESELAVVMDGIVVCLLRHIETTAAVEASEIIDSLIGPALVKETFLTGTSLLTSLHQPISNKHEAVTLGCTKESVHIFLQKLDGGRIRLGRHRQRNKKNGQGKQ